MTPNFVLPFNGNKLTVASVSFLPFEIERPFKSSPESGYYTKYVMPVSQRGEFHTIEIVDAWQRTYVGEGNYMPTPESAVNIANDFIHHARNGLGASVGLGPGVWVADGPATFANPKFKKQYDEAMAGQEKWCAYLIGLADQYHLQGNRAEIGSLHRDAGTWMKVDPRKFPWMQDLKPGDSKPCPMCATAIDILAIQCPICKTIVDNERYVQFMKAQREALKELEKFESEALKVDAELERLTAPDLPSAVVAASKKPHHHQPGA